MKFLENDAHKGSNQSGDRLAREAKGTLRAEIRARRRTRPADERERDDAAIVAHLRALAAQHANALGRPPAVAAYDPLPPGPGGPEPGCAGSYSAGIVEALAEVCAEVWLPISGEEGQLTWAKYAGREAMAPGPFGIREPTGPRHGSEVLAGMDFIVVPAMAVSHAGIRLGKGAGYYDRALGAIATYSEGGPLTVVVVADNEVRADVPALAHDVPMAARVTPSGISYF